MNTRKNVIDVTTKPCSYWVINRWPLILILPLSPSALSFYAFAVHIQSLFTKRVNIRLSSPIIRLLTVCINWELTLIDVQLRNSVYGKELPVFIIGFATGDTSIWLHICLWRYNENSRFWKLHKGNAKENSKSNWVVSVFIKKNTSVIVSKPHAYKQQRFNRKKLRSASLCSVGFS